MVKCTFCGKDVEEGTGMIYIRDDARILNFCSSKCKNNLTKLKRNPVHVKWTDRFKK